MDQPVDEPVEQTPIPIFDTVTLAVRSADGQLWLAVNDLAVAVNVVPTLSAAACGPTCCCVAMCATSVSRRLAACSRSYSFNWRAWACG